MDFYITFRLIAHFCTNPYGHPSGQDQNTGRQLEGIQIERLFEDKVSGKDLNRPALDALLSFVREGDAVIVHSMDRLARNLDDLRGLVQGLVKRGVRVEFVKEKLVFTGDDSPLATLHLSIMGAFAEFERALILERQREGIELAKRRGAYKGSAPKVQGVDLDRLLAAAHGCKNKAQLAREFNISRETLYKYLRGGESRKPDVDNGQYAQEDNTKESLAQVCATGAGLAK